MFPLLSPCCAHTPAKHHTAPSRHTAHCPNRRPERTPRPRVEGKLNQMAASFPASVQKAPSRHELRKNTSAHQSALSRRELATTGSHAAGCSRSPSWPWAVFGSRRPCPPDTCFLSVAVVMLNELLQMTGPQQHLEVQEVSLCFPKGRAHHKSPTLFSNQLALPARTHTSSRLDLTGFLLISYFLSS